jgi:hypothetical protein
LTDSRRFHIVTVVDDCKWACLARIVDTSLSGTMVARDLAEPVGNIPPAVAETNLKAVLET